MAYTKQNWVDSVTLVDAEHLNHIEAGIEAANNAASLTIGTVTTGDTASASISDGKLNLVLVNGKDGKDGIDGKEGTPGAAGPAGTTPQITAEATVEEGTGTPEVTVEKTGTQEAPKFTFKFKNLNGKDGKDGADGIPGTPGRDGETYTLPNATTEAIGGVKQAAAQDNSTATDASGIVTDFNALLEKLRTAGILATGTN